MFLLCLLFKKVIKSTYLTGCHKHRLIWGVQVSLDMSAQANGCKKFLHGLQSVIEQFGLVIQGEHSC